MIYNSKNHTTFRNRQFIEVEKTSVSNYMEGGDKQLFLNHVYKIKCSYLISFSSYELSGLNDSHYFLLSAIWFELVEREEDQVNRCINNIYCDTATETLTHKGKFYKYIPSDITNREFLPRVTGLVSVFQNTHGW